MYKRQFQDRASDIHHVLYYSKKPEDLQPDFIANVLGNITPLTAKDQKTTFQSLVSDTLGEDCEDVYKRQVINDFLQLFDFFIHKIISLFYIFHPLNDLPQILQTG